MLLTPRLCYEREFLGHGMFHGGPACALFRTEAFRALGGFADRGVGSDYLFWLQACATTTVLLVPGDLFWYRQHPGQEMVQPTAQHEYARLGADTWRALHADACPLDGPSRELARRNRAFLVARTAARHLLRAEFTLARLQIAFSGLSLGDWIRYLRLPRRSALAGTAPVAVVPDPALAPMSGAGQPAVRR